MTFQRSDWDLLKESDEPPSSTPLSFPSLREVRGSITVRLRGLRNNSLPSRLDPLGGTGRSRFQGTKVPFNSNLVPGSSDPTTVSVTVFTCLRTEWELTPTLTKTPESTVYPFQTPHLSTKNRNWFTFKDGCTVETKSPTLPWELHYCSNYPSNPWADLSDDRVPSENP